MKRIFHFLLQFIFFGNLFVSASAAFISYQSFLLIGISDFSVAVHYSILVFFSTLFLYNFQRIFFSKKYETPQASERQKWILKNKIMLVFLAIISFLAIGYELFFFGIDLLIWLVPLFIISVAYFLPAFNLRNIIGVKSAMIALVWAAVTASIPFLLEQKNLFENAQILMFSERFLFILSLAIVFNIRDIKTDTENGMKTLATTLGTKKTIQLSGCVILLFMVVVLTEHAFGYYLLNHAGALILSGFISLIVLWQLKNFNSEYYYIAGIDGLILLQPLLLMLSENFF